MIYFTAPECFHILESFWRGSMGHVTAWLKICELRIRTFIVHCLDSRLGIQVSQIHLSQTRAALDLWLRFWSAGLNYRFGQIIDHYNWWNDWPYTKHCFNATNTEIKRPDTLREKKFFIIKMTNQFSLCTAVFLQFTEPSIHGYRWMMPHINNPFPMISGYYARTETMRKCCIQGATLTDSLQVIHCRSNSRAVEGSIEITLLTLKKEKTNHCQLCFVVSWQRN